jgi:glycosyltransferase involved in cell wall biosynthesis
VRVAIVNKADEASGGAGKMAANLQRWLDDDGHETRLFLAHPSGRDGTTAVWRRTTRLAKSIEVRTLMNEVLPLDYPALRRAVRQFDPDVIHVHDISRAYSVDSIRLLAKHYPTVWTLHDQSAMTGGCISPVPCDRYMTGCGSCPKFGAWSLQGRTDLTSYALRRRAAFHREGRAVIATPSHWAAKRFGTSPVLSQCDTIHVVPNAIAPGEVSLLSQEAARRKVGIPRDRFVIVLVSHDLNDLAKNPASQGEALRSIADLRPLLVLMGNSNIEYERALAPLEVRGLGFVADDRMKRLVYGSADVFVNTSLSDTFSLTTLESLAAGTPVVAYASGGIPEILTDSCGVLVPPDDGRALAGALRHLATDGIPDNWPSAARARAREFSPRRHVDAYVRLYEHALARSS